MIIDLSKAKVGDKFRTRDGRILKYLGENLDYIEDKYELIDEQGNIKHFYRHGGYLDDEEFELDLVEQVFDNEKDRAITDKILKDVEKVVNGVAEAMPLIESATIANLSREPLPENREDDDELQRRQDVVELAERIFFSDRGNMYIFKECVEIAENSVNIRNQYLKDGKL